MPGLRIFRGSDEALEVVGDRGTLVDVLQNSGQHTREELLREVMACYSGTAYGASNWPKFNGGWSTPKEPTVHTTFANRYPHLSQLNLDPGIMTHMPEFLEFLEGAGSQEYWPLRDAFKRHLGVKTVWRGMVLTEEEADKVRVEGIESDFLRKKDEMPAVIDNFEANVLSVYVDELVERHFHGENSHSPLVSVSSYEDVAIAVGRHFGRRSVSEGKKRLYLFKINIPEIDVIFCTDHAVRPPYKLQESIRRGTQLRVSVNGCDSSYPWDRHVESYILHKVDSKEIVEVSMPAIELSSWNGQVCK